MPFHSFRGQRSAKPKRQRGDSQASMRHPSTCFDQDGRPFSFEAENSTGMPCGLLEPQFTAPYKIDPQYVGVNPDNTSECYCDWRRLVGDRISAMKNYHRRAVEKADKNGWPTPKLGEYSDDIRDACGPPTRAYQLAVACEQGNPWALGLFYDPRGKSWGPKSERHTIPAKPDKRLVKYLEGLSREIDENIDHYDYSATSYDELLASVGEHPGTAAGKPAPFAARRAPKSDVTGTAYRDADAQVAAETDENRAAVDEFDALMGGGEPVESDDDGAPVEVEEDDETLTEEYIRAEQDAIDAAGDDEDDDDEPLLDDDEGDPEALGGRTVKPENADKAKRQAPLRVGKTARARKRGARASDAGHSVARAGGKPWDPAGRKSLADGAEPVIAKE